MLKYQNYTLSHSTQPLNHEGTDKNFIELIIYEVFWGINNSQSLAVPSKQASCWWKANKIHQFMIFGVASLLRLQEPRDAGSKRSDEGSKRDARRMWAACRQGKRHTESASLRISYMYSVINVQLTAH